MNKERNDLLPRLTKKEVIYGCILLVLYLILLPVAVELASQLLSKYANIQLTQTVTTLLPYYISFILTVIMFRHFLKASLNVFAKRFFICIQAMVLAYLLMYFLSIAVNLTFYSGTEVVSNPNDVAIEELLGENSKMVFVLAVLLAPLIEETIFRGVVFGTVWNKNKFLAYAVSWLLFGGIHLAQYAILNSDWSIMLMIVDYLPSSIALAWCYKKCGTIWAPVFLHMIINLLNYVILKSL